MFSTFRRFLPVNTYTMKYKAAITATILTGAYTSQFITPSFSSYTQKKKILPTAYAGFNPEFLDDMRKLDDEDPNFSVLGPVKNGGMSTERFLPFRLADAEIVSKDTCVYFFQLNHPEATLDMPITSYVLAQTIIDGEQIIRPYTPLGNIMGVFPLLVKTYPGGKMSGHFARLEVGDKINFKGPFIKYHYNANEYDRLTLIAGGTGITPMYQMIDGILSDENDRTRVHLLYANRRVDDILMKAVLDAFAEAYPDRFKVTYMVDAPSKDWSGPTGFINADIVNAIAGAPNPHHKIFVCGPPGLMKSVCGTKGPNYTQGETTGILRDLGFTEKDVYKF